MISADYIVGLTDGEGCFYVNIRPPRFPNSKERVETHFYIKLRENNLFLLKEIKKFFGCGGIYYQKEKRPNHSGCYRFEINSQVDINGILIPFFKKHPLIGPKRRDFLIFRKITELVEKKSHRNKTGLRRIKALKQQMNLGSLSAGNPLA